LTIQRQWQYRIHKTQDEDKQANKQTDNQTKNKQNTHREN